MKIMLMNGHLVMKKNKTGVHVVHEELTKRIFANHMNEHDIKSLFFTLGNGDEYNEMIENKNYTWIRNRIIKISTLQSLCLYFLPISIFAEKSDLYFCDGIVPFTNRASKKVSIVHDLMTYVYPENYTFVQKMYAKLYFRRLNKSDLILVISQSTKDDLISYLHIDERKIKIVRLGCNTAVFSSDTSTDTRIDYNKKYYFYIGDMRKNKNLENAILAFHKYIKETNCDTYFYIAGSKKFEYQKLENLVEKLNIKNRVIFLGYVSDDEKIKLYQNCFALLFVSMYEGFGIPIIEAANFDKPFITSNTSSMKELGEGSSLLCNPTDIDSIASSMVKLDDKCTYETEVLLSSKLKLEYTWDNCYEDVWRNFMIVLSNDKDVS